MPATTHLTLGREGENLAATYLERSGLVILSRNWRCRDGELDVVATDGHQLIVCEVKTRSGTAFGMPAEAVTDKQARRVRHAARAWRNQYGVSVCPTRYDIVSILWPPGGKPRINHLRDVF